MKSKNILNPLKDRSFSNKFEVNFNFNRLQYLLYYFNVDIDFVLDKINEGTKNKVKIQDLKKDKIKLSLLKKIDKIFDKGISFYTSMENIEKTKSKSIFFRKKVVDDLNFEDIKVVSKFEDKRLECEILAQNINYDVKRVFRKYNYKTDDVLDVVKEIREFFKIYEKENLNTKFFQDENKNSEGGKSKYLKTLFKIIENNNIFIFEHKEYWQERWNKEKLKFDGFFISPYLIVLKQQKSVRKETFTLLHEFAHYLIDEEEVEGIEEKFKITNNKIENWCYNFAFYFELYEYKTSFENLEFAKKENNLQKENIEIFYNKTFLSYSSLYTGLRNLNKIDEIHYRNKLN